MLSVVPLVCPIPDAVRPKVGFPARKRMNLCIEWYNALLVCD